MLSSHRQVNKQKDGRRETEECFEYYLSRLNNVNITKTGERTEWQGNIGMFWVLPLVSTMLTSHRQINKQKDGQRETEECSEYYLWCLNKKCFEYYLWCLNNVKITQTGEQTERRTEGNRGVLWALPLTSLCVQYVVSTMLTSDTGGQTDTQTETWVLPLMLLCVQQVVSTRLMSDASDPTCPERKNAQISAYNKMR